MGKFLSLTFMGLLFLLGASGQTAQWAVRPTSAQLEGYGNLLKVKKNGKYGLMSHDNQEVVKAEYDSISPFRDGYALAMTKKGNQLIIDAIITEGDYEMLPLNEEVFATRYAWFSEGKMPVKGVEGWGYLGLDGNMAIPCQFQQAYPFSEGFASVMLDDKAYFIDKNMDYLNVEAGYGDLVFASTFSGGESVVYSVNMKGYVINRNGRTLRTYKTKVTDLKPNRYDHTVGDKTQLFNEQVTQLPEDDSYSVYRDGRLWGYKRNGKVVLPAQLDEAGPVQGEYANVRFKGQNGVLRMVDGSFSIEMKNALVKVDNGNVKNGEITLFVPSSLEDANINLKLIDDSSQDFFVNAIVTQGEQRLFYIRPFQVPLQSETKKCRLEIWCENLLLWKENVQVDFEVKKEEIKPIKGESTSIKKKETKEPIMVIASLSLSKPKATSKKANPKNDFYVTVSISNSGDMFGSANVSLYVDGKLVGNKTVGVGGHKTAKAIFAVHDIKKERYANVRATLKNGKSSDEAKIRFVPF